MHIYSENSTCILCTTTFPLAIHILSGRRGGEKNFCKKKKTKKNLIINNVFQSDFFCCSVTALEFVICCFTFKHRTYMYYSTESFTEWWSWPLTVKLKICVRLQICLCFLSLILLSTGLDPLPQFFLLFFLRNLSLFMQFWYLT